MKTAVKNHLLAWPARAGWRFNAAQAFTLIELLVVIATLAMLSAVLLPALAGSRAQPRVTACAANFRQWAVSVNLYANDHLDSLPRFDWGSGSGNYLWDVATNTVTALGPYGVTVPMWFDPVRPEEFDAAERKFEQTFPGQTIGSLQDLQAVFNLNAFRECVINHNWWVQRSSTLPASSTSIYPPDPTPVFLVLNPWMRGTPVGNYGFPKKLHDNAAAHVPFISCKAGSTLTQNVGFVPPPTGKASSDPNDISPNTAHFVNGVLLGVNAAYADGHVESHNKKQMNSGYVSGSVWWFY